MSNSQKNFMSIRSKLLAAVAMLLVASFMVVSSTYAWFTLSTAPEVTGITTQIGANGNLEIALNTTNTDPLNSIGATDLVEKNATWGNIVDLNNEAYGLNTIVLKPSVLAVITSTDAIGKVDSTPLYTPVYGADGRVSSINKNGFYGSWSGNGFKLQSEGATTGYGVRALGTVSSMTAQQLQYATSVSAAKTSLENANNYASMSLKDNGGALVTLILKGATNDNPSFTVKDNEATTGINENEFAPLDAMISRLEDVPEELEEAIKNYMLIALAYDNATLSDNIFNSAVTQFNAKWDGEDGIFAQLKSGAPTISVTVEGVGTYSGNVPTTMTTIMAAYNKIVASIGSASDAYDEVLAAGDTADWEDLKAILLYLMQIDGTDDGSGTNKVGGVEINGENYDAIMAKKTDGTLYSWAFGVAQKGVQIKMPKGSGVYADIASLTKNININFTADIDVEVSGQSLQLEDMNINMYTDLKEDEITNITPLLPALRPADRGTDSDAVITDIYAYVLDFVFRTNAAGSNLLLQQRATDRIYTNNTDTESETWGGGSYMEFSTQQGFGEEAVKNLMSNIRLVFTDTKTGEILVGGYLDTANATSDGSMVKAQVKLEALTVQTLSTTVGGQTVETHTLVRGDALEDNAQVITALGQNEATYISVYVYLDGNTTGNEDVAAIANLSTSGNLNLQFASSATLVPMDYANLQTKN